MSIATMIYLAAPRGVSEGDEVVICDRLNDGGLRITLSYNGDWFSAYVVDSNSRGFSATGRSREKAVSDALDAYLDGLPRTVQVIETREGDADDGAGELIA